MIYLYFHVKWFFISFNFVVSEVCCKHANILNIIFENSIALKTLLKEQQKTMENICQANKEHNEQNMINNFDSVPKKPFKKFEKLLDYDNDILRKLEDSKRQLVSNSIIILYFIDIVFFRKHCFICVEDKIVKNP